MEKLIEFSSEGQTIRGKFQSPAKNAPVILLSHGFESSMDGNKWNLFVPWLFNLGYATFRFNYRGSGTGETKSDGKFEDVTLSARIKDYQAALDYLQTTDVDQKRIGVIGSSFGAFTILAAADKRVKVIVCLAALHTFPQPTPEELADLKKSGAVVLASGNKLKAVFFTDLRHYDVLQKVTTIRQPLLLFHGGKDEIVPEEQAHEIYAAAAGPKRLEILEGSDHSFTERRYCDRIMGISQEWLKHYL